MRESPSDRRAPSGFRDISFDYVYDIALTALQFVQGQVSIHHDSDFAWRAVTVTQSDGDFAVRLSNSDWCFLHPAEVVRGNIGADPSSPFPIWRELIIPTGGRIEVDIRNLSNDDNVVQLMFRGVKRYRTVE